MHFKNSPSRWGSTSILLHWVVAITVISLFSLGLWMTSLTYYDAWYTRGPFIHKSVGIILFVVLILRLVWRKVSPPPLPLSEHATWEKKLAHWVHGGLYLLLIAIMFSGYFISTADGRGISVFDWIEVPAFVLGVEQQEELAGTIHFYLAITMMILVALHAAGALKHHFIDKDETLRRMLRPS